MPFEDHQRTKLMRILHRERKQQKIFQQKPPEGKSHRYIIMELPYDKIKRSKVARNQITINKSVKVRLYNPSDPNDPEILKTFIF